jgi:hypothetical protein
LPNPGTPLLVLGVKSELALVLRPQLVILKHHLRLWSQQRQNTRRRKKEKRKARANFPAMAKSRRDADVDMTEEEGAKRVRKPGQDIASGRVHDEEEHAGNLKFEVRFFIWQDIIKLSRTHARMHARTNTLR